MYVVNGFNFDAAKMNLLEAADLEEFAKAIVLEGYINMSHPAWVTWFLSSGYPESQKLLVYSTLFPQRALVSLIDFDYTNCDYE